MLFNGNGPTEFAKWAGSWAHMGLKTKEKIIKLVSFDYLVECINDQIKLADFLKGLILCLRPTNNYHD